MKQPEDLKGDYIGRTASDDNEAPDFEEVPIWIDPSKDGSQSGTVFDNDVPDPDLNSFAVIERGNDKILQYGRVSSGYEYSSRAEPGIQQRDKSMGYEAREIRESPLDEDVFRVIRVELLGEVKFKDESELKDPDEKRWELRRPTKLPQVGQKVYELGASELATLLEMPSAEDGLEIGSIESGGESVPFRLDQKFISRHVAILGRTGVGKTHTGHVIIEEMIRHNRDEQGVPVVTFDAEDDVGNMAEDVGGITLKPEDDTMHVPFQVIGWSEYSRFLGSMATEKQRQVIARAYSRIHREALENLENDGEIGVGIREFKQYVIESASNFDYNRTEQAVIRATSVITGSSVLSGSMNDWEDLLRENPIVNIDISGLGDSNRGIVVSAVARLLRILRTENQVPPFMLAIDEAHEFVPSGTSNQSTAVVRDLVKTARHIGIGVMLMTQSPSELDSRTLRTCNTYITLALSKPEVNEIKGLLSDLSDRSLTQIPNMERGRAFVGAARDIMTHTVPVEVRGRETEGGTPTPNLFERSETWFDQSGGRQQEE
ncbi:ATP-binding protein [Haloferax larsenii]|uniref:ATP-binding protein n=1 Tax=Haloferax larsenii TaxID=302484 RepID=A0ABY5REJ8_HALLR|nr:ATP-binding protein [Haloferax larsenii]UVE50774.1 ATP-binding protein [Haloferax larsenii]